VLLQQDDEFRHFNLPLTTPFKCSLLWLISMYISKRESFSVDRHWRINKHLNYFTCMLYLHRYFTNRNWIPLHDFTKLNNFQTLNTLPFLKFALWNTCKLISYCRLLNWNIIV
jgi:hypothetical protein